MQKPNYNIMIPPNVRYDPNLKDLSKLLYGEICILSIKNGYCFMTNKTFAELYNTNERTIIRCINNLKECGYIFCEYEKNPNNKNRDMRKIYLTGDKNVMGDKNVTTMGDKNVTTTGDKNVIQIYTSNINNTRDEYINNKEQIEKELEILNFDWIHDD